MDGDSLYAESEVAELIKLVLIKKRWEYSPGVFLRVSNIVGQ